MGYVPLTVKEPDGSSLHGHLSMLPGRIFATQEVAIISQEHHARKQAASTRNTDESKTEEFSIEHIKGNVHSGPRGSSLSWSLWSSLQFPTAKWFKNELHLPSERDGLITYYFELHLALESFHQSTPNL